MRAKQCYVRHFEQRADRPSDDRYGRSIRVKPNMAAVLRRELSRASWNRDEVALGTATDPYQPAEGKFRLTRTCLVELDASWTPRAYLGTAMTAPILEQVRRTTAAVPSPRRRPSRMPEPRQLALTV